MKNLLLALLNLLVFTKNAAAQVPTPAPKQAAPILILNGKAHLGNGQVIENSAIAFENGKITLVADATTIRLDRSKFSKIFDAAGKHVYPGLIAPNSKLGLVEVGAVRATQDYSEIGSINPNARSLPAYNTDSEVIPTVRSNGVLLAQIVSEGGLISGTSSVVQLDAWNWEDAALRADNGMHLRWPASNETANWWDEGAPKKNEKYDREVEQLHQFFAEAKGYLATAATAETNLRFEAMRGVFSGKQKLYVHTHSAKMIREAVLFAEKFGLKPVLVGGNDAWLLADFLKTHDVAVILSEVHRLPAREDEAVDQAFRTPAILEKAGVLFAFAGMEDRAWQTRNLSFQAGHAVGFGLAPEAAVQAMTLNTAKILGIEDLAGSLELEKQATLFISEGDVLDMKSAKVVAAFINGREVNLDDKHKQLERRFREKYRQ